MATPSDKKKAATKAKRPTALKRKIQSDKRNLINRAFKASVQTSIRFFNEALKNANEPGQIKEKLSLVYSLMDKGVKKGIFKKQKAARTKRRLHARLAKG